MPASFGASEADDKLVESLVTRGVLSAEPQPLPENSDVTDDLSHVGALFAAQLPQATLLGVWRVENGGLAGIYGAVRDAMEMPNELSLWHGTTAESVRNIALNGFNRAYSGRHGTKYGQGTYFSLDSAYSVRFCDRKRPRRMMFLAKVLVGAWAKGSPDMVEPPLRDGDGMARYDSTVDDVDAPSMFCVFRDFQAVPCYLVEFAAAAQAA